ncbi:MAG TPA: 1-(5-phosphoribosyl)-5-[(5-phosphoribosylamino)methylideneamino] imidazole-4-carboxamide isomerase [Candidatus Dormibacteraeota bacterium]|nr:1-(5-phosphoribosyl)-5-[(5-phosphoribosylamino)methylideneamino] imidazole-4-carboxamide isomerase [Candidatus Dormibacteraeota bacterium]
MLVIPSIDLRGGRVVRLLHGDYDRETVFSDDAVAVVSSFAASGARRVHVIDLDSARGGADAASAGAATAVVAALAGLGVEVQVGGGVRDAATARRWFDSGATHVVLGSLAVGDPEAAAALCRAFPGRVLLALDVRDGVARAQGWTRSAGDALDHLARWAAWPVAGVVHTAIDRDGTLTGPSIDALGSVCARFPGPVIASGGVATIEDVRACRDAGAAGVIVGRALHEGSFDLRAALASFPGGTAA